MPNIADVIEEYIKARLGRSSGGVIIFRRNELAERFRCVPSQINYVLSTRFTSSRGYIIETRRGGGGFIRVIRVSLAEAEDLFDIMKRKIGDQLSFPDALDLVRYLYEEDLITKREAHMIENVLEIAAPDQNPEADQLRAAILKAVLVILLRHEK